MILETKKMNDNTKTTGRDSPTQTSGSSTPSTTARATLRSHSVTITRELSRHPMETNRLIGGRLRIHNGDSETNKQAGAGDISSIFTSGLCFFSGKSDL